MTVRSFYIFLLLIALGTEARGQVFDSGSTGTDGALILTTPGTVLFNPGMFSARSNSARNDVYHFTSVYIGKDVIVKLSSAQFGGPVFWLSTGSVEIDGVIDLNGGDGGLSPAVAGAGGYPGGAVQHAAYKPEGFNSNVFLVPLSGGVGGDGGETQGGGAGGGALLIASSSSITVDGTILANGGSTQGGNGGGGGAIRLVAPLIGGSAGSLSAKGGQSGGADGRIRFETFDNQYVGSLNDTPFVQGKPFGVFLPPTPAPTVRLSIGGVALEKSEFTITGLATSPVEIGIEAHDIPAGTVIQLEIFQEHGASQILESTPLVGAFELSRAVVSVTFPKGKSSSQFRAVWKQPPPN